MSSGFRLLACWLPPTPFPYVFPRPPMERMDGLGNLTGERGKTSRPSSPRLKAGASGRQNLVKNET